MKSLPTAIHAAWSVEKSGGEGVRCAGASAVSATQARPIKAPAARQLLLEVSVDIVASPLAAVAPTREPLSSRSAPGIPVGAIFARRPHRFEPLHPVRLRPCGSPV